MGIEQSMPEGVIRETDDIKGHVLALQIRVEIPAHICFLRALDMDDDLCFWAHFSYSLTVFQVLHHFFYLSNRVTVFLDFLEEFDL